MRPLATDLALFLLPLAVGVVLFLVGRAFRRWPWPLRAAITVVSLALIALPLLSLAHLLPQEVEQVASRVGGFTLLLCSLALFLFGVVWSVPGRSFSSTFLIAMSAVCLVMIAIESSGRVWWRFVSPEIWDRTADSEGVLQQSSAITCSPTAAVMLLHQAGITAGEGEMAYLAGTTVLGTDSEGIARALEAKAAAHGWRVEAGHTTYAECLRRGGPFLAHVKGRYLGHAVMVARITPNEVIVFDPADGQIYRLQRDEFEHDWDGVAVRLVR